MIPIARSYDGIYQLVREQRSGANGYDVSYSYDALGNRLTKLESGVITSYSYDEANQLSYDYTPTLRTTYTYDANGNTTLINAGGSVTTYSWDGENRMTLAELPAGGRTTATYDGDGKRRSYADSAGLRGFFWDGENIACETDGAGATVAAYSYAPSGYGALLSQRRSGATSFHHYDAFGSTTHLTDASQSPTDSYLYRAFGEPTVLSGSSPNPFTWVGQLGYYRQPDTSDYWVRARVYGPARGRWVSHDVLLNHVNRFLYAWNSPMVFVDLSGLAPVKAPPIGQVVPGSPSLDDLYEPIAQFILRDPHTSPGLPQATGRTPLAKSIVDYIKRAAAEAVREAKVMCGSTLTTTGYVEILDPKHLDRRGKLCNCEWHLVSAANTDLEWDDRLPSYRRVEIGRPAQGPTRYSWKTGRPVSSRPVGGRIPVRSAADIAANAASAAYRFDICRGVCVDKAGGTVAKWILNALLTPEGGAELALPSTNPWYWCTLRMSGIAREKGGRMPAVPTQATISAPRTYVLP